MDDKCGTQRTSMNKNPLLSKPELGKPKKILFNNPDPERSFGLPLRPDPEGAREVTMIWKEHRANPDDKPGPDFIAMNKSAAMSGLTSAKEMPTYRNTNYQIIKKVDPKYKPPVPLPSDADPGHTYGLPSSHRTAEQCRVAGTFEPPVKHLVQSAYQHDWVKMNTTRAEYLDTSKHYVQPCTTYAAEGHATGAYEKYLKPQESGEPWKMSKFKNVEPRVTQYMGK